MTQPIDKMKLSCFRGASGVSEVHFDPKKPLALIFGENGTGKSTIVDSIDLIANRKLGSLEDRSMGRKIGYLPTIGRDKSDVAVELTCGDKAWVGKVSGQNIEVSGDGDPPTVRILRRSKLLQLIEATPKDRYEALRGFIDVARVEQSEQSLRDALRSAEGELNNMAATIVDAEESLNQLWQKEGSPEDDAQSWAKSKSETDRGALETKIHELGTVLRRLNDVAGHTTSLAEAEGTHAKAASASEEITEEITKLPEVGGKQALVLVKLLTQAQQVLSAPEAADTCPVCEQPVRSEDLRRSISARLADMKVFDDLGKRQKLAVDRLAGAEKARVAAIGSLIGSVRTAATACKGDPHAPPGRDEITWPDYEDFLGSDSTDEEWLALAKSLGTAIVALTTEYQTSKTAAEADVHQLNAIKTSYDRIVEHRTKALSLEKLIKRLKRAVSVVEETRKAFTQSVLEAVGAESTRLYEIIHPGESLGAPRLRLDPKKRTSVEQDASFAGHTKVPPQAYYSESHLDTLGFCVWLAIVKREHPDKTVVVLDDIFTSVDGVHLTRIMDLLSDIVPDFLQVIVTTHYRTWRDRYRYHRAPGVNVQLLELHRWTLSRGIRLSGTSLAVSDLKAVLAKEPLDRQAVASQSGILLESLLDGLTLQYRRRLPRNREGVWTLGDLLDGCTKLGKVLEIEKPGSDGDDGEADGADSPATVKVSITPLLNTVASLGFIRNQVGCHFNLAGCDVADSDVEAFGKSTVDLAEALLCPSCGDLPRRAAGSFFQCGCKTTMMHPLEYTK